MANPDKRALSQKIAADPRVQAYVRSNTRGSAPVWLGPDQLRELGYDVPGDWKYLAGNGGRLGTPRLIDENDKWDKIVGTGAAAVMGGGALLSAVAPAAASATSSTVAGMGGTGAGLTGVGAGGVGSTAIRYGLQYGLPIAGQLIGARMQSNALRDSSEIEADYLNRALEAAKEEQQYRRGFDEEQRDYSRAQQTESTNYGRRNYGNFVETLEPYRAAGTTASARLSELLGQSGAPYSGGTYYDVARDARTPVGGGQTPAAAPGQPPVSTTMPVGGGPRLVLMEAPDGTQKQVPAEKVAALEQRGARRA